MGRPQFAPRPGRTGPSAAAAAGGCLGEPGRCSANPAGVSAEAGEWTSWFNVDHPGGDGDFESLAAIRFYYGPARVCPRPLALEARTTNWALPAAVGERVHLHPTRGFWCLNREQPRGRRCSNYHVRFRCPRGKVGVGGTRGESRGPQWAEPGGWAWPGEGPANGIRGRASEESGSLQWAV